MCSSCLSARSRRLSYFICLFCTAATMLFGLAAWLLLFSQCEMRVSPCWKDSRLPDMSKAERGVTDRSNAAFVRSEHDRTCCLFFLAFSLVAFSFFAFCHPFRTVFSFVFCNYSCLKYRLLGVVVDTEDWGFMMVGFFLLIFSVLVFCLLLSQVLHEHAMKNLSAAVLGEELWKPLLIAEQFWRY